MIRVYVESVRRPVGTDQVASEFYRVDPLTSQSGAYSKAGRIRVTQEHRVDTVTRFEFVLPEDQKRFLEIVESFASEHDHYLEVIDLGTKNRFERWVQKNIKGIETCPTLITDAGHRIKGNITREELESRLPAA